MKRRGLGKVPAGGRTRRGRAGFTLVEMMMAIGALGVVVVGAMAAQFVCRNLSVQSRETNTALSDLEACMEEVLLEELSTLPVKGSAFEAGLPVAAYQGLHLENESIAVTYPNWAGGTVPDPLEVLLTITWDDPHGRPRSLVLRTFKSQ